MNFDEWCSTFQPIRNPTDHASCEGLCFETYGEDLAAVLQAHALDPRTVWTLIAEDDDMFICEGYHFVNRMGYFISTQPYLGTDSLSIPY